MCNVTSMKSLRHQNFDIAADDFIMRIAEQRGDLLIGKSNDARGINDEQRIRGSIEDAAGEIGWRRPH